MIQAVFHALLPLPPPQLKKWKCLRHLLYRVTDELGKFGVRITFPDTDDLVVILKFGNTFPSTSPLPPPQLKKWKCLRHLLNLRVAPE